MRIGIDFDNTIINYDPLFVRAAKDRGLIAGNFSGSTKLAVRDAIRSLPNGENSWQRLQGYVYAHAIMDASLFEGVDHFMKRCSQEGHLVSIVSHKTEFGHFDPTQKNLRLAALEWMRARGFFHDNGFRLSAKNVYFESSRCEKIGRIANLACTHFIDDLPEVLRDPKFPPNVERILFSANATDTNERFVARQSWQEIEEWLFR
jgi:hypothetical protein